MREQRGFHHFFNPLNEQHCPAALRDPSFSRQFHDVNSVVSLYVLILFQSSSSLLPRLGWRDRCRCPLAPKWARRTESRCLPNQRDSQSRFRLECRGWCSRDPCAHHRRQPLCAFEETGSCGETCSSQGGYASQVTFASRTLGSSGLWGGASARRARDLRLEKTVSFQLLCSYT